MTCVTTYGAQKCIEIMVLCHKDETMVHRCMIGLDHGIHCPYEKLHDGIGLLHFQVSNDFWHKLLEKIIKQANSLKKL